MSMLLVTKKYDRVLKVEYTGSGLVCRTIMYDSLWLKNGTCDVDGKGDDVH